MLFRVILRQQAIDESVEAARYIALHGTPGAALRWQDGFEAAVDSLSETPARCGPARESARFPRLGLRQLLYGPHRIIFVIVADEVQVLHVRHAARRNLKDMR